MTGTTATAVGRPASSSNTPQRRRACEEAAGTGGGGAHLAQLLGVLVELLQDGQRLLLGAVLQDPLDDSAAVRVRGEHKHLPRGSAFTG